MTNRASVTFPSVATAMNTIIMSVILAGQLLRLEVFGIRAEGIPHLHELLLHLGEINLPQANKVLEASRRRRRTHRCGTQPVRHAHRP